MIDKFMQMAIEEAKCGHAEGEFQSVQYSLKMVN